MDGIERGSFRSAYSLEKQLETLDPFREYLSWTEATLECGEHLPTFYYRNIVSCVRYLIRQVAYKELMVYAPIREYDSNGDQLYWKCTQQTGGGKLRYDKSAITYLHSTKIL